MPITPVDNTVRTQQTSTTASPPMRRTSTTQTAQEPADLKFLKPKSSTGSVSSIQSDLASLKKDFTGGTTATSNIVDRIGGLIDSLTKAITGLAGGTTSSSTTTASRTASTTPAPAAAKKSDKKDLLSTILPLLLTSLSKPATPPPPVANPFASNSFGQSSNPVQNLFSFNNNTSVFTGLFGGTGSGLFGIGDIFNQMVSDPTYTQGRGKVANAASAAAALGKPNALNDTLKNLVSGISS